ncbi:ribosomal RNA small subunit methyltransferase A [candidate division KSB1 bacterium]|nr:MAG: ribosomal RNA small subunit methyltransferase A [candidate division KSB1 bacterium]
MQNHESKRPLKKFSQNFLTNPFYQQKIVQSLKISSQDTIVEIGPGQGALTQHVVSAQPKRIIAVEIDKRWVNLLKEKFGTSIEIIQQDILKVDLENLAAESRRIKVIGNLPYHITSPILFRLIEAHRTIDCAILMMQKEVAKRICAKPNNKDYGILSVITQTYAQAEYLFEIKRGNFFPAPNVDSAVVALHFFSKIPDLEDADLFRKIVRGTFNFRRKTLKNSLSRIFDKAFVNSLDDTILSKRPEQLTVEDFKQLSNYFKTR